MKYPILGVQFRSSIDDHNDNLAHVDRPLNVIANPCHMDDHWQSFEIDSKMR